MEINVIFQQLFFSFDTPKCRLQAHYRSFFPMWAHSQKNAQQTRHPQLFVSFSSSRFALYFCYNFRTTYSNEVIFSEVLGKAEAHLPTKEQTFWATWLLRKVNKTVAKTSSRYARLSRYVKRYSEIQCTLNIGMHSCVSNCIISIK